MFLRSRHTLEKCFICLFLVVLAVNFWLSPRNPSYRFKDFEKLRFPLQQNGEYWIYQDFIRAESHNIGYNHSITLTSHGTYRDLSNLEWLIVRWEAPISLAVFVFKNDFEKVMARLNYLRYCTVTRSSFRRWVSVHLVIPQNHVPVNLRNIDASGYFGSLCRIPFQTPRSKESFLLKTHTRYPSSLLKNVARWNAKTYYTFNLELDLLPTKHLAKNFMQFIKHQRLRQPLKSVFCLLIFEQPMDIKIFPRYKSDLRASFEGFSLDKTSQEKDIHLWLNSKGKDDEVGIYQLTQESRFCEAHIGINSHMPFYDQRSDDYPFLNNNLQMQLLVGLKFDFVILDGVFLIRRRTEHTQLLYRNTFAPKKLNQVGDLMKLNSLVLWPETE